MSAAPKSQQQPIVFVVDDDISVRESLRRLRPQVNFWRARAQRRRAVWCSMFLFRVITVSNCRS